MQAGSYDEGDTFLLLLSLDREKLITGEDDVPTKFLRKLSGRTCMFSFSLSNLCHVLCLPMF